MAPPALLEHPSLAECRELLAFEQLVAEPEVEALAIAIFPRAFRFDVERLHTDPTERAVLLGSRTMPSVSAALSSRIIRVRRCARGGPTTEHARRSEMSTR